MDGNKSKAKCRIGLTIGLACVFHLLLFVLIVSGSRQALASLPIANINVVQTQDPPQGECMAEVGQPIEITYIITLNQTAAGNSASNVIFDEVLPAGADIIDVQPGGACSVNGNEVSCNFNQISMQEIVSITFNITPNTFAMIVSNQASVTFDRGLCNFGGGCLNNGDCDPMMGDFCELDSSVCSADGEESCGAGFTCPSDMCVGGGEFKFCNINSGLSCDTNQDCPPNLCTTQGKLSNTVMCSVAGGPTPPPVTPPPVTPTPVVGEAIVNILKQTNVVSVPFGDTSPATFTIILQSVGDATAEDVIVEDSLPSGVSFVSASEECDEIDPGLVRCNVGDLSPGMDAELMINVNINPSGFNDIENIATVGFIDPANKMQVDSDSNTINITVTGCNPLFNGIFNGDTRFVRRESAFPENEDVIDPTTVSVTVGDNSVNGIFNANWLQNVPFQGACAGNVATLSDAPFDGACPGMILGNVTTLTLIPPNELVVRGVGEDCKSVYDFFTQMGAPLIREGTQGNRSGGGGTASGSTGCSIGQGAVVSSLVPLLTILTIPLIISIKRRVFKLKNKQGYKRAKKMLKKFVVLIVTANIFVAFVLLVPTPARAQKIIKQCPNSPNAAQFEVVCEQLKRKEGNLTPREQQLLNKCESLFANENADEVCASLDSQPTDVPDIVSSLLRVQSNNEIKKIRTRIGDRWRGGPASSISVQGVAMNLDGHEPSTREPRGQLALDPSDEQSKGMLASDVPSFALVNQASENGETSSFSKLGFFLNSSFNWGDKDTTGRQTGYDFNIFEITGGADYRFGDNLILGLAFNYNRWNVDLFGSRGNLDANVFSGTLYGSYYIKDFYVDGLVTIGGVTYDIRRDVFSTENGKTKLGTATADSSGAYYAFALSPGYDFHYKAFSAGPYARFTYNRANIDGYTESVNPDSDVLALKVNSQNAQSLTTALGARTSYDFSTTIGVLIPQLSFEWVHEYKDDPIGTTASFAGTGGLDENPSFSINGPSVDRDTFNIGGGISAVLTHGISAFVYYEATLGWENFNSQYITGGIRFEL